MSKRRFKNGEDQKNDDLDVPPMSRLFIVCSRQNTEEELREHFNPFGQIQEVWVLKDRSSGESKGVAYIKFSKTSEAAKAVEEMHGKTIGQNARPIKVMIASSRNGGSTFKNKNSEYEEERSMRLFIIIAREMTDDNLYEQFGQYGDIDNVSILRDRQTKEGKGFAYIKFKKFSSAALAFEKCDSKYKAVFAEPRPQKGQPGSFPENFSTCNSGGGNNHGGSFSEERFSSQDSQPTECVLSVICSPLVNQDQLWRLFDIIPGLDYCHMNGDFDSNNNCASVVYNNAQSALHARQKLHGFEYPPGERLIVKLNCEMKSFPPGSSGIPSLLDGCASSSMMMGIKQEGRDNFCSAKLPAPQPLASPNATCAQRCFIVCSPHTLPVNILKQAFCRFGNLIDVYLLPNRNCGYVKFSAESSAKAAMATLHGAEIYGVKLKVLEAEEPREQRKRPRDPADI